VKTAQLGDFNKTVVHPALVCKKDHLLQIHPPPLSNRHGVPEHQKYLIDDTTINYKATKMSFLWL